jgi:hypothetical protein
MYKLSLFVCVLTLLFGASPAAAQQFELSVEHEHTLRNCQGTLVITPEQIEYKTSHKHAVQRWRYTEIQQLKVEGSNALKLVSYDDQKRLLGRDRLYKFRLLNGEITPEISALLQAQATKPIVTSVPPATSGEPVFGVPVKHLHSFGGCLGVLRLYADHVIFEAADAPAESRYWRYTELHNVSQPERFRFELTTFEERFGGPKAYHFQLRGELPAGFYDYAWARVYPSKFQGKFPTPK